MAALTLILHDQSGFRHSVQRQRVRTQSQRTTTFFLGARVRKGATATGRTSEIALCWVGLPWRLDDQSASASLSLSSFG